MNKYFISISPELENTAWYKAIIDVEYFLISMNFKPIPLYDCIHDMENCLSNILSPGGKTQEPDEAGIIFIQYPRSSFEGLNLFSFTNLIKGKYKSMKIVGLVHDLDSMRYGNFFKTNILTEVNEINLFDYVIAVNTSMSNLLKEQGVTSKVYSLNIFDYMLNDKLPEKEKKNNDTITIAYAGNLKYSKSPFVYQLQNIDFNNIVVMLYGPGFNEERFQSSSNVKYMGNFLSNNLPFNIDADYGLCWDGDYLNTCGGTIGEYLKYTNPHKTSLYLAMGMPVIISSKITTSEFIKQENAGVIIDSLYDLPSVLRSISEKEYINLQKNAKNLSKKLRNGFFLKNIIKKIEKSILKKGGIEND